MNSAKNLLYLLHFEPKNQLRLRRMLEFCFMEAGLDLLVNVVIVTVDKHAFDHVRYCCNSFSLFCSESHPSATSGKMKTRHGSAHACFNAFVVLHQMIDSSIWWPPMGLQSPIDSKLPETHILHHEGVGFRVVLSTSIHSGCGLGRAECRWRHCEP